MKYLDLIGLSEVWANIKSYISSKIPTKTSQLQNDSNYATTSQLPSKTSQLTNDSDFTTNAKLTSKANDSDVVHKSGNETINGVKNFNDVVLGEQSGVIRIGNNGEGALFCNLYYDGGIYNNIKLFYPKTDNEYNLGTSTNKWANVYANRISFPSDYYITTDTNDNSLRIIRDGTGHGNNYKVIIQGDTGKFFAPNGFIGNLQGNADTATNATQASFSNQLQAFTGDDFTGGNHFVKAIRSTSGWSTRLWMCYNGGAKTSNEISVAYADSAGNADTATSANDPNAVHKTNTDYTFRNYGLNSLNIDEKYNENYVVGISEDGYGTRPIGGWTNIINFCTYHFLTQLCIPIDVNKDTDCMYIRTRWANNTTWGEWRKSANDNSVVHKSGDEVINGDKTFSNLIQARDMLNVYDGINLHSFVSISRGWVEISNPNYCCIDFKHEGTQDYLGRIGLHPSNALFLETINGAPIWANGRNIVRSINGVTADNNGNVNIQGFSNGIGEIIQGYYVPNGIVQKDGSVYFGTLARPEPGATLSDFRDINITITDEFHPEAGKIYDYNQIFSTLYLHSYDSDSAVGANFDCYSSPKLDKWFGGWIKVAGSNLVRNSGKYLCTSVSPYGYAVTLRYNLTMSCEMVSNRPGGSSPNYGCTIKSKTVPQNQMTVTSKATFMRVG